MSMRIGGIASGMDTNQLIRDLMAVERMPLNRLFQQKQTLDWQRDAFREINLAMTNFRNKVSNIRLQASFSSFGVQASSSTSLTATAASNAAPGNYNVVVEKLSSAGKINSANPIITGNGQAAITGTGTALVKTASQTITLDSSKILNDDVLTIDGTTIHFYDSSKEGEANASYHHSIDINGLTSGELAQTIAGLTIESGSVSISAQDRKLVITAVESGASGNNVETSFSGAAGVSGTGNLKGGSDSGTLTISRRPLDGDRLTINNQVIQFFNSSNGTPAGDADYFIDISNRTTEQIAQSIGALQADLGVDIQVSGNKLEITPNNPEVTTSYHSLQAARGSDKILSPGDAPQEFTITNLHGYSATITVDVNDTYASLANKITNARGEDGRSLGIRASFDNTTSRFFISTRDMGGDQGFTIENTEFVQNQILGGGTTFSAAGEFGKITFDGIEIDNIRSNNVTVQGISLNLIKADPNETITLNVYSDVDKTFNMIKDFVNSYNELIELIEGKLNEPRYRDYPPLTDEQRRGLSDREAELWDERAMSGMLRNDPLLRSALNQMRSLMSQPLEGVAEGQLNALFQIGISTGNYRDGGKLFINEDRLRAALTEKPDEVRALFTRMGDSPAQRGIGNRIFDQLGDSLRGLRNKAGLPGTTSADTSTIAQGIRRVDQQITRMEARMVQIENRYWKQFTAMEKAMNQMNQQSMWMMQNMFGGF